MNYTHSTVSLSGRRWSLASSHRESWVVVETAEGPRGVRLVRKDDEVVIYEVGAFFVMLSYDKDCLLTIPVEDSDESEDRALVDAWVKAGTPAVPAGKVRAMLGTEER